MGGDRWDEVWEGELHMVPPPSGRHQWLGSKLIRVLGPAADAKGLEVAHEMGFFRASDDYRLPDLAFYRRDQASRRGLEAPASCWSSWSRPGTRAGPSWRGTRLEVVAAAGAVVVSP